MGTNDGASRRTRQQADATDAADAADATDADGVTGATSALCDLVARLRGEGGCPWDRAQTLEDVRSYLIEEAHEAAAAIDSGDWDRLREELGDLLFQVAFVAQLAAEAGAFDFAEAARAVTDKMIARHPHVFDQREQRLDSADQVAAAWERRKQREGRGLLDGVPDSLPALVAAWRIGQKAAGVGFDWSGPGPVLEKVREELAELEAEIALAEALGDERAASGTGLEGEIGDLLQATASLARHLGIDPERALARSNQKFRRRFTRIETQLGERLGEPPEDLEARQREMEDLWQAAKRES
ncbi:MAG: nucleoside triphosphate pyrophosphohydrolase [Acidobacteria bacterium]|mgnify:CR=1 FL=1|nr:MAG: nucleoside triphosphate pyrophosphohydrolase [Acidobacteriota bacterium]